LLARRITRPVGQLAAAAATLAGGGRPPPVAAPEGGEVGELAAAFNAMVARLEEAERRRLAAERQAMAGRVAAAVAHEVRNPLSSVRMLVQMVHGRLAGEPGLARERGYAEVVLRELERVELVVQDLLDLARPRPLVRRPCDLGAVVEEVARLVGPHLAHRGIRLVREVEGDPHPLEADADRLKQALLNLLLNGAEAMAEGGEIRLAVRWPTGPRGRVAVAVRDHGPGVEPEEAEALFEPFRSGRPAGSGLGLAVSRQIARDHGGDLTLAPADGGGTIATLTLPVGGPSAAAAEAAP
ncbi:MAG: HAMP domain-containing protein, partial [Nitrospirae bacterium]